MLTLLEIPLIALGALAAWVLWRRPPASAGRAYALSLACFAGAVALCIAVIRRTARGDDIFGAQLQWFTVLLALFALGVAADYYERWRTPK